MGKWKKVKLGSLLQESKIESPRATKERVGIVGKWQKTQIGEFLFERKGKYKPDDKAITGLKRLNKIDFSGNFHIAQKPSNTNMILIKSGDLVISGINVAKGAMGIYSEEKDITATIHYSSYTFDAKKIDVQYFKRFLKSAEFIKLLNEQVKGGIKTEIKPKHLLSLEIELPDIGEQKQKTQHFKSVESEDTKLKQEITHQQTLLKKLRQQILQEAIEGKLTAGWRTKNSPPSEGWQAQPDGVVLNEQQPNKTPRNAKNFHRLPYNPKLKQRARELRKAGNLSEVLLWNQIKRNKLKGLDFDRQKIIGNYIVDFYCPNCQAVIEIDGSSHDDKQEYDAKRDRYLKGLGLAVIHIADSDVKKNLEGVMQWLEGHSALVEGTTPSSLRDATPPKEGNAAVLLERIRVEKERLVKVGEIRRQKPLPPIRDDEKPFDLPEGWVWCRLDSIIYESPRNGYSPKTVDFPTTTKTLKLGATTTGKFIDSEIKYINEEIPVDSFLWLNKRNILIQRGNSMDFVGVSAIYSGETHKFIYPDLMMKLKPVKSISEVYIHHVLMSPFCRKYFRDNATGSQKSMPKINQGIVSSALIPFCSQVEQKAIVTKVKALLTFCDQLETQITQNKTHANALMQAVLKEAFTHDI